MKLRFYLLLSLLIATVTFASLQGDKGRPKYHFSRAGLIDDLREYKLVKPRSVDLSTMSIPDDAHPAGLKAFEVSAFGRHFRVLLQPNDFFAHGYKEIKMDSDGNVLEEKSGEQVKTDCYYTGRVEGDELSKVVVTTCGKTNPNDEAKDDDDDDGSLGSSSITNARRFTTQSMRDTRETPANTLQLDGYIKAFGVEMYIEPAIAHAGNILESIDAAHHIVFRPQDLKEQEEATCGTDEYMADVDPRLYTVDVDNRVHRLHPQSLDEYTTNIPEAQEQGQEKGDKDKGKSPTDRQLLSIWSNNSPQKYMEVILANDYQRWKQRGEGVFALSKAVMNYVTFLYASDTADQWRFQIQVRLVAMITFTGGDPYAAPGFDTTGTDVLTSPLLTNWRKWTYSTTKLPAFDAAVLLSGYEFAGSTIGLAVMNSMCAKTSTAQSANIVQCNLRNNIPAITGATVSHELGHLLGMQHDSIFKTPVPSQAYLDANCNVKPAKVMSPTVSSSVAATTWSPCSKYYVDYWMTNRGTNQYNTTYRPACLENTPKVTWDVTTARFGDGIVQDGEECDCGARDCADVDPCCTQATCQLKSTAQCSELEPCCSSCRIISDKRVCRAAVNSACDVAETCAGASGKCPDDQWKNTGGSCTWNSAFPSGKCYQGDCFSHARQCQDATTTGLTGAECSAHGDANDADCNYLYCAKASGCYYSLSPVSIRYVFDGTPCGSGKQCFGGACVASSTLVPATPSSTGRSRL